MLERREAFPLFAPLSAAKSFAMQYLEHGRVGWDIPHTTAVANYAHLIACGEGLDPLVMITAAWLHDIGYYNLIEPSQSAYYPSRGRDEMKLLHMEYGAESAKKFFKSVEHRGWYTPKQRDAIVEIVGIHDSYEKYSKPEHDAFREADILGKIGAPLTFKSIEDAQCYTRKIIAESGNFFTTATGVALFNSTIELYFDQLDRLRLLERYRSQ